MVKTLNQFTVIVMACPKCHAFPTHHFFSNSETLAYKEYKEWVQQGNETGQFTEVQLITELEGSSNEVLAKHKVWEHPQHLS